MYVVDLPIFYVDLPTLVHVGNAEKEQLDSIKGGEKNQYTPIYDLTQMSYLNYQLSD